MQCDITGVQHTESVTHAMQHAITVISIDTHVGQVCPDLLLSTTSFYIEPQKVTVDKWKIEIPRLFKIAQL